MLITEPDRYLARQMARQGLPAFVYHFSYVPAAARPTSFGAAHGSEVTYVFANLQRCADQLRRPHLPGRDARRPAALRRHARLLGRLRQDRRPGQRRRPRLAALHHRADRLLEFGADGVNVRKDFAKPRLDLIEQGRKPPAG